MQLDLSGGIDITVQGGEGPTGKTTVQMIIANALQAAGYTVKCSDDAFHPGRRVNFQKMVGQYHAKPPAPLLPQEIRIRTRVSGS